MGIDLELADHAVAHGRFDDCSNSGSPCAHSPNCEANLLRIRQRGPWEFSYTRRFGEINETMLLTGMGYDGKPEPFLAGDDDLRWRSQTIAGKRGIPAFKLRSNDTWLVTVREIDEALDAYAGVPAEQRAALETDARWVAWLDWLTLAKESGGFEVE